MKIIKIGNKTSIESLEKEYENLNGIEVVDLTISKKISSIDFGLIPAIIQFIATWYNKTVNGKIILELKNDDTVEDFYKLDFIFPSLVYCWDRLIVDTDGNDLKPLLKKQNEGQHDKMKRQTEGGGQSVLLSCFDHLSINKGLLNAFYIDGIFIENEIQFGSALDKSLKQVLSFNRSLTTVNIAPVFLEIVNVIYELMKNTDDWGRTDKYNKPLSPNGRGLFLKFHKKKQSSLLAEYENHKGLKNYFSKDNFISNAVDELYFLELSVYDTGIGFIERYNPVGVLEKDTNEQVNIIKECMLLNNTSASGLSKTIKGKGLDRIMNILDNKGFFWLRTGNVSIFRNLIQNRYKDNCSIDDVELFDWFSNSADVYTKLQYTQGSVITLVYPISNLSNV